MPSGSFGPEFPAVSKPPRVAFPSDIWAPCTQRKLFSAITDYVNARSVPQNFSKHMVYFLLLDAPESEDMRRFVEVQNPANHIDEDFVAEALAERVRRKTIVELGCRCACFLRLLKNLGAKAVYGVTDRSYADEARREIGKENVVINYTTDLSLVSTAFLASQQPDIVLNVGLLDWGQS